jgi:hypothetical protein
MKIVHGQDDAAGAEPRMAKADAMAFLQAALAGQDFKACQRAPALRLHE